MKSGGVTAAQPKSWLFSAADSRKVRDIEGDARVELTYADPARWTFVAMSGRASIVRDGRDHAPRRAPRPTMTEVTASSRIAQARYIGNTLSASDSRAATVLR